MDDEHHHIALTVPMLDWLKRPTPPEEGETLPIFAVAVHKNGEQVGTAALQPVFNVERGWHFAVTLDL